MKNNIRIKLRQCSGTFSLPSVNIGKEEFLPQNARRRCFSNKEGKRAEGSNCNQRQVKEMKHRSVAILVLLAMMLVSLPHTMRQARELVTAAENRLWLACLDALLSIPFDDAPQQDTHAVCQAQNDYPAGNGRTNLIERRFVRKAILIEPSRPTGSRNSLGSRTRIALSSHAETAASRLLNSNYLKFEAVEESLRENNLIAETSVEPNFLEVDVPMPSWIAYRRDENPISQKRPAPVSIKDGIATFKVNNQPIRITNLDEVIAQSIAFTLVEGRNKKALKLRLKYTEGHKAPHHVPRSCPLPINSDLFDEHAIANLIMPNKDVSTGCDGIAIVRKFCSEALS